MTKREVNRLIAELADEIKMVNKNKRQYDRKLKAFDDSNFSGRIETNEIKRARVESFRLSKVISDLEKQKHVHELYKKNI